MGKEAPEFYLVYDPIAGTNPIRFTFMEGIRQYLRETCKGYKEEELARIRISGVIEVEAWKPNLTMDVQLEEVDLYT